VDAITIKLNGGNTKMKQKIKIKTEKIKVKTVNPWQVHLKKVYADMKVKNKSVKLSEAMKSAKLTYKKK